MKKSLLLFQYRNALELYSKLKKRLDKNLASGSFYKFTKRKRAQLVARIERLKAQLNGLQQGLKWTSAALAMSAMLNVTDANAQATPIGTEFLVNTTTAGSQAHNEIASDANGNFVIVWESEPQDGDLGGIYAQRYDATGAAVGSEFKVNTTTAGDQSDPVVAIDNSGKFVIAWESTDASSKGIFAQRYNADGSANGTEFQVNTYTTNKQVSPDIAIDADGDFVITWQSYTQDGGDYGIYAQQYNAAGAAQGSEFRVNTTTAESQYQPSVAMDDNGNFAITWASYLQDGNNSGIYAQRYNAAGVVQGSEFKVNTTVADVQEDPSIAMDADGDFVITWESDNQDSDGLGIYAQRYNNSGAPQLSEFKVNTTLTDDQDSPSIAMDDDGDFVIGWRTYNQGGPGYDSYAQCFDEVGTPKGSEFKVNTTSTDEGYQFFPNIAIDSDGDFVITWWTYDQDGDETGIYAQRYTGGFTTAVQNNSTLLFSFYPNPAKDQVQIDLNGTYNVRILNLYGQLMLEENLSGNSMNIESLKTGTYVIEVSQDGQKATQKLVIE